MGTAQVVLPHPAVALLIVHREVALTLASSGDRGLCFVLLCFLPSSCLDLEFPAWQTSFLPHKAEWGPWHTWGSGVLLYSYSKSKTTASSRFDSFLCCLKAADHYFTCTSCVTPKRSSIPLKCGLTRSGWPRSDQ